MMALLPLVPLLVAAPALPPSTAGPLIDGSLAKWHGRSVYFVMTDRFARDTDAPSPACGNGTKEWCGGTLKGVTRQLDYIAGMGFDALWITPVVEQVPWRDHWNGTGYHGYWARDFHAIDPHLGTPEDLVALSAACKKRGMLFMLDVVANHVGPVHSVEQLEQLGPNLNSATGEQVHTLDHQPGESLENYIACSTYPQCVHPVEMNSAGKQCWPDYTFGLGCNYTVLVDGWLGDRADLNQEHPPTSRYLLDWIQGMVQNYSIDGLRLDTALYMPRGFLQEFQQSAGVYIVGEVVTLNHSLHRSFTPPLSGLLNFPTNLHFRGGEIWGHAGDGKRGSLQVLASHLETQRALQYPDPHLLGNFVDNHDGSRFMFNHSFGGETILQNGLAMVMLYHGLPIVYQGTEQPALAGLADQRTAMFGLYKTDTPMYNFLTTINSIRRTMGFGPGGADATTEARVVPTLVPDHHAMVFVRGDIIVLLSNIGRRAAPGKGTRLPCINSSDLGTRWGHVCPGSGSTICVGVRHLLGSQATCTCRDDKAQMCLGTRHGKPAVFGLQASLPSAAAGSDGPL